jgi:hypothetical protein
LRFGIFINNFYLAQKNGPCQPGAVQSLLKQVGETLYAVSTTDGAVSSAGRFALSQTFALQRPINGAATTIANEIAIAILTAFSFSRGVHAFRHRETSAKIAYPGVFNIDVLTIGSNRY